MDNLPAELFEPLSDGLPKISHYAEFRRIMGLRETDDNFQKWLQIATTIMMKSKGTS